MSNFKKLCPVCKTYNHYKHPRGGEVSMDNGKTWQTVKVIVCKDCNGFFHPDQMLKVEFKVSTFIGRDGKRKFLPMTNEYKEKRWPNSKGGKRAKRNSINKAERKLLAKLRGK